MVHEKPELTIYTMMLTTRELRGLRMLTHLLANPTTIKVLLVLLELGQTYQFQLVRMTGAHPSTIKVAVGVLIEMKLVKIVPPQEKIKNAGDFYGLTQHGKAVAEHLRSVVALLGEHR
jgi:DNA-binding MarR family transcriptional regulator